ncbi:zinc finger CCCH domain-containing protein 44-like [Vitis riparia]|uniref:zinc finger CCCH domain-containing protein 44-like n=1 Tax=Vitis riparia TaxID=96939 RepID=UPI00155B18BD|nr:zinc finger CCCH domain-containing protein 44-like [Vitis riparia]
MIGPRCEAWHCEGPLGESAGPFSLPMLKIWSDVNPYALKYRVWKVGECKDKAIFLSDLIHGPNEHSKDNFEVVEEKKQSLGIHHNESKMGDDGYDEQRVASKKKRSSKIECEAWHCLGPLGERPGPFSLPLLRRWSEINAGASKYKVWKVGQSEEQAIPLNDAISQILPIKSEKN